MKSQESGYVYILTNPSFKEDWIKIGKSSRPVDVRSKELDNTAVPLPFEIFATIKTTKYNEVEKIVHKTIDRLTNLRIRQNREFFNVAPQVSLDIFRDIATAIDDAEIIEYENNQPIDNETGIASANRAVNRSSDTAMSDTASIQLEFWKRFNENAYTDTAFSSKFKLRKPYAQHWYDLSVGSSNFHICMTASRQKRELSVGLYIDSDKSIFYKFQSISQQIEEELGMKVQWREANKASRFLIERAFDIDDKKTWDDGINWLYKMCCKFKELVEKYK